MAIKHFLQELSNGFPQPIYVLYSSEDFFLYDSLSLIKERYNHDSFNLDIFDLNSPDDTKPMVEIIDILKTPPFLFGKRIVVLQNSQKILKKDLEILQGYISNPSEGSVLIMLFLEPIPKVFEETIKRIKTINLNLSDKDIPEWIREKAKSMGYSLTDDSINYLIDAIGDLGLICSELKKFSSLNKKNIDLQDIKGLVYAAEDYTAFDLIDALERKDKSKVFKIYEIIKYSIEPQIILGAINHYYSKTKQKNKEIFRLLHEADVGIKTSRSFTIENLLMRLIKI